MMKIEKANIAVIGLGYVGLPLAVAFGKKYPTIGFDIDIERIEGLRLGEDRTREVSLEEMLAADRLSFCYKPAEISQCNIYVVTVPTPIDRYRRPDLSPLISASKLVGEGLKHGDLVIYESTVYPGTTEEICVPVLEEVSGLKMNQDFFVGYSPERINPGDRSRRLEAITKVTSGSTPETANFVDGLYASILTAGTHKASSIRVAEASKVIENTQRDLNIALINELALIFNKLNIDTKEVLEAAATKWNFLNFTPGLVGGHCIGVDPYYLTHKAQEIGYHPDVILAGRRINDGMAAFVAGQLLRLMIRAGATIATSKVLVLGLAFKENCPDIRNSKVVDIVRILEADGIQVDVHDPWVDSHEAMKEYSIPLVDNPASSHYDAVLVAVPHDQFIEAGVGSWKACMKSRGVIYDVKSVFPVAEVDGRL